MPEPLQRVRGFPDRLPKDFAKQNHIISTAFEVARRFCFEPVATNLVEMAEVFQRTGESASAVNQEMYLLKGKEELALRPEGTASVARMFLTEKLRPPCRFVYSGPMFRHERPQKGRFRQFTTVAVEILGESEEKADVESLASAWFFLKELQLTAKVFLEINTIGSLEERKTYIKHLIDYLKPYEKNLSRESQIRLKKNPLRILDSKQKEDQKILENAPCITDHLTSETKNSYSFIKQQLNHLSIPFQENSSLVRGLDYYNHLVFEIKSHQLGAQSALIAGGRYDSLVENLGGPPTPATGWGAGVERLALLYEQPSPFIPKIAMVAVGKEPQEKAFHKTLELREKGYSVYFWFSGNFSKQMKRVSEKECPVTLIFGEKEIKDQTVTVKNMKTKKQEIIKIEDLEQILQNYINRV